MKVLGLSCGRKMGNSEILIREALMETEQFGAEVEVIRLGDLTIKPCTGCTSCTTDRIIKGGEGKCVQKNDHMPFILDKLAESDAVILGVPAFMLMPPGLLTMIMNRTLGAGKKYGERVDSNPKVGAVITVGGTDWVNLVIPLTSFNLYRLLRGNIKIVDEMLVTFVGSPAQVLLHDEMITRARKLGHNVGEALKIPFDEVKPMKEDEETCPLCHTNLLKVSGEFVECPFCDIRGKLDMKGGKIKVVFDDKELEKSRFSAWGVKKHDDGRLRGRQEYAAGKAEIREKLKKYKGHKPVTSPPPLKQTSK